MNSFRFSIERDVPTFTYKMVMKVDVMLMKPDNDYLGGWSDSVSPSASMHVQHKKNTVACQFSESMLATDFWDIHIALQIELMFRKLNEQEPVVDLLTIFEYGKSEIYQALVGHPTGNGLGIDVKKYETAQRILDNIRYALSSDNEGTDAKIIVPEPFWTPPAEEPVESLRIPEINKRVPALYEIVQYPKGSKYAGKWATLSNIIQWLNDKEKWSREQIADWLESLDVDLTVEIE